MHPTLRKIKRRFPYPIQDFPLSARTPTTYSVGGACCQYTQKTGANFPYAVEVAASLMQLNPLLTKPQAIEYAMQIVVTIDMLPALKGEDSGCREQPGAIPATLCRCPEGICWLGFR